MIDNLSDRDYFIPSFTTILLLQIQAYVVQLLVDLKESTSYIYQLIQWPLLVVLSILDNVAYLLNLDHEINRLRDCQKKTPRDQDSSNSGQNIIQLSKDVSGQVNVTFAGPHPICFFWTHAVFIKQSFRHKAAYLASRNSPQGYSGQHATSYLIPKENQE
ncbi:hypothetical protein G6F58_012752 [Rhizopus delemar]|nr:hypothetical protein G6F58_012752 [Rhizopus delemar]